MGSLGQDSTASGLIRTMSETIAANVDAGGWLLEMRNALHLLALLLGCTMLIGCGGGGGGRNTTWSVRQNGDIVEIAYGSGTDFPQDAALHLDSSYFRMNYGPDSGWGTSVIGAAVLLGAGQLSSRRPSCLCLEHRRSGLAHLDQRDRLAAPRTRHGTSVPARGELHAGAGSDECDRRRSA